MAERIILTADDGCIYTHGKIYGSPIYLADGENADGFYKITREEYTAIIEAEKQEIIQEIELNITGDIDTSLDGIIAIQESLIGGDAS